MFDGNRFGRWMKRWLDQGASLLAPPHRRCAYCGGAVRSQSGQFGLLCAVCSGKVPWIREIRCGVCGRPEHCPDCVRRKETFFVRNRSAVRYDAEMKNMLARYKFRGDERLRHVLVDMLCFAYGSLAEASDPAGGKLRFSCITYVPVTRERLEERGFNQAEQLASGLGQAVGIPVLPLLMRTRHTDKQSKKARSERLVDIQNAFVTDEACVAHILRSPRKPAILLIDDVYTTGSTLNQCAKALVSAIDADVYGLTWARS